MRNSILLVRPFHIIHQISIIVLVLGLKHIFPTLSDFLLVWLMVFLLMPFLFGLNDYWHRLDDQKMNRDRLFTNHHISPNFVLMSSLSLLLIMNVIAFQRSAVTGGLLYSMILSGLLYGYLKKKKRMLLTYLFRLLSGVTFYLVVASYFHLTEADVLVALFVGFLDLYSHIAGDLRDFKKDKIGNVNTFPVRFGINKTLILIESVGFFTLINYFIFEATILRLHSFATLLVLPMFLIISIVIFWFQDSEKYKWFHAMFHGSKISVYFMLGASLLFTPQLSILLLVFGFLPLWFLSYYLYLWADHRL